MSCIIAATSSCINGEGLTLVDPTLLEEKAALSTVSMAFSSRNVAQWTLTKGSICLYNLLLKRIDDNVT